jgi:DNA polymerase-4
MTDCARTERLIFHIDADAFFAAVEQASNPHLRNRPVVVCGIPLEHGVVTAASYEARKFGVKAGIPFFQARALLPHGVFLPVNIPKYLSYSLRLLAIYLQYTPLVEAYSVDEVFLDLTGAPEPPEVLGEKIRRQIFRETGLTVTAGAGPNKLVAKIATETVKPNGLCVIRAGELPGRLAPLPVSVCPGIGPKTAEVLQAAGITTLGQLAAVPLVKLRAVFGLWGEKLHYAALGINDEPVLPLDRRPPEKSIGHETTFPTPLTSARRLEGVIWVLSSKAAFRLREKKLLATGVRVKIRSKINEKKIETKTFQRQLPVTATSETQLAPAARELFFTHWTGLPVKGLGVTATGLIPEETARRQLSLFPEIYPGADQLEPVLDRLRRKYGEDILVRAANLLAGE